MRVPDDGQTMWDTWQPQVLEKLIKILIISKQIVKKSIILVDWGNELHSFPEFSGSEFKYIRLIHDIIQFDSIIQ